MRLLFQPLALLFLLLAGPQSGADDLDDFIRQQLLKRQVPGLSIAIIQDGKIVKAKSYGFIDKGRTTPVTPATLFQAGSISKAVAAVGALHLVGTGQLALDEDVNAKLRSWKVPENEFTKDKKVTLRGLLSHTTGLTVHGFPGYEVGKPVPTVVQILDGVSPANTPAVRVDFVPGTRWRYSGGGYTVMQQLLLDVTGQPFPQYMQKTVLIPLGMRESTYEQPLPVDKAKMTATGHYPDRQLVKGRWHIYPEMAAAGLWTTPSDLARFAIGVQNAFAGKADAILSQAITQQMLTNQMDNDGLGVFLEGEGRSMRFGHRGRDEGFDALMTAGIETGQGVVIMINANDNSQLMSRIVDAVAREYHWAGFSAKTTTPRPVAAVNPQALGHFEGRYELSNNRMIAFRAGKDRLFTLVDGLADEEFVPETATRFVSTDREASITFSPDKKGEVIGLVWKEGPEERNVPRIGPLFHTPKSTPDPNPTRTRQIETALKAMAQGGKAVDETPGITAGARRDFKGGSGELNGVQSLVFLGTENVTGRGIERHASPVSQIVAYRILSRQPDRTEQYVIVHLAPDGLVTDYDVVSQ